MLITSDLYDTRDMLVWVSECLVCSVMFAKLSEVACWIH